MISCLLAALLVLLGDPRPAKAPHFVKIDHMAYQLSAIVVNETQGARVNLFLNAAAVAPPGACALLVGFVDGDGAPFVRPDGRPLFKRVVLDGESSFDSWGNISMPVARPIRSVIPER